MPQRTRATSSDCPVGAWLWASTTDRVDLIDPRYVNCPVKVVGISKDAIHIKFADTERHGIMQDVPLKIMETAAGFLYIALPGEIARFVEHEKRKVAERLSGLQSHAHLLCTAPGT